MYIIELNMNEKYNSRFKNYNSNNRNYDIAYLLHIECITLKKLCFDEKQQSILYELAIMMNE